MKAKNIYDLISSNSVSIPLFLMKNKNLLKLDNEQLIFIMYLNNFGISSIFNPNKYSDDLGLELDKVLDIVSYLTSNSLIEINASKNEKGIMEEVISLRLFYNKIVNILTSDVEYTDQDNLENIYDKIEKEFGRTLTPMEYEIIGAWIDCGYSDELISEALKEAVYNGVSNLRYIDKILYEWSKKGYKNKSDVDKSREKWKNKNQDNLNTPKAKKEVFDYNWLEDQDNE